VQEGAEVARDPPRLRIDEVDAVEVVEARRELPCPLSAGVLGVQDLAERTDGPAALAVEKAHCEKVVVEDAQRGRILQHPRLVAAGEGVVHGGDEFVDGDGAVAVDVEQQAGVQRRRAQGDVHAGDDFVHRHRAILAAVADAETGGRSTPQQQGNAGDKQRTGF